jgi:transposase
MTRPYSEDLRERALLLEEQGATIRAIGDALQISPSCVLDNLASLKGKAARKVIRAKGAHLIFLPPYSPDLNPIEQVFAKLKHMMCKAQPRTVEATWQKVGKLLDLFAPGECTNDLRNSGYAAG